MRSAIGGREVRVEKRKWDGTRSAVEHGTLVAASDEVVAWLVVAGTVRERPTTGETQSLAVDEIWAAAPGEWWVLCARGRVDGSIAEYVLHAAAPFEPPEPHVIRWIDLDLDFEVRDAVLELEDETEFHRHARTMAYPDHVIRGAWSGISQVAPRYTTGEWPFDGWMERCLALGRAQLANERPDADV